jgi:hypothetical protein
VRYQSIRQFGSSPPGATGLDGLIALNSNCYFFTVPKPLASVSKKFRAPRPGSGSEPSGIHGAQYPSSLGEFQAWFQTDADCLDYLELGTHQGAWMPPTCQATSTSSCSASIVGTPEAKGCCSTASWNLQSPMPQFATRTSQPTRSRGRCPQSLRVAADIHPVWRCLTRDGHGGRVPNQANRNAKVPEGSAGPQFKNVSASRATPVKWRAKVLFMPR